MGTKIFASVLISLLFSFCATSSYIRTPDGTERTIIFENQTSDHVWNVCMKTLNETGYRISESKKERGSIKAASAGPIEVEFDSEDESSRQLRDSGFLLTILISEQNRKVAIVCRVPNYGSTLDSSKSIREETELRRFFEYKFKKNQNKQPGGIMRNFFLSGRIPILACQKLRTPRSAWPALLKPFLQFREAFPVFLV